MRGGGGGAQYARYDNKYKTARFELVPPTLDDGFGYGFETTLSFDLPAEIPTSLYLLESVMIRRLLN
jgi:hypothetical protein